MSRLIKYLLPVCFLLLVIFFLMPLDSNKKLVGDQAVHNHIHSVSAAKLKYQDGKKNQSRVVENSLKKSLDQSSAPKLTKSKLSKITSDVKLLIQKLPNSREELLAFVYKEDLYKKDGVKPHTVDEIHQNKLGALKVYALRALIESSKSTVEKKVSLEEVIDNAEDPTIRNIAEAALDSLDEGRPFFEDIVTALSGVGF